MNKSEKRDNIISNCFFVIFFGLLIYAGYLSYKSIDFQVLNRLEAQKLILPTPIPTSNTSEKISQQNTE